jgi:glycosyltransferase involved in cell wall biosynthesis
VRIVSLCRVERRKGLINLLMAARILKEQLPAGSFEVRIVGPVSEEAYYHELLEYKSQWHLEEVVFSGALPLDDRSVPSLLEGSSVFVLPSLQETFGIVNLEAMASGLPIVATRVGGVPEVVLDGETGFIVPPNDPEALAEKSAALIRDKKLREEMGRRGRRRVEELYSVERISRMVVDIYEELT